MTVSYTPFDLPKAITQGATTVTLAYDGDERRVRKTTPKEETLYFGDLYERVTEMGSATTQHRYYVHSPERVVAVVKRGGSNPGTHYIHVDHLGSVDALTNAVGGVDERRSYDAFGQRRNPTWGQPPPPSFSSKTTKGFTGHESDDELGLVNMNGRVFDPKLGRFLTTDPVVSNLLNGQAFNAYGYVRNNPLTFVDPSGFTEQSAQLPLGWEAAKAFDAAPSLTVWIFGERPDRAENKPPEAAKVGASAPPTDVDTTGSSPITEPDVPIPSPDGASIGDIAIGGLRGLVNAALTNGVYGVAEVVTGVDLRTWQGVRHAIEGLQDGGIWGYLDAVNPLSPLIDSGVAAYDAAMAGDYPKVAEIVTPVVVSVVAGVVVGKIAGAVEGAAAEGTGAKAAAAEGATTAGVKPSRRPSTGTRKQADQRAAGVDGKIRCEYCQVEVKDTAGSPTSKEYDHVTPYSRGGNSEPGNIKVGCRTCNRSKGARTPEEWKGSNSE